MAGVVGQRASEAQTKSLTCVSITDLGWWYIGRYKAMSSDPKQAEYSDRMLCEWLSARAVNLHCGEGRYML